MISGLKKISRKVSDWLEWVFGPETLPTPPICKPSGKRKSAFLFRLLAPEQLEVKAEIPGKKKSILKWLISSEPLEEKQVSAKKESGFIRWFLAGDELEEKRPRQTNRKGFLAWLFEKEILTG